MENALAKKGEQKGSSWRTHWERWTLSGSLVPQLWGAKASESQQLENRDLDSDLPTGKSKKKDTTGKYLEKLQGDTDARRVYLGCFWGWAVQVYKYLNTCTACKPVEEYLCWDLHWDFILFISAIDVMGSCYMEGKQGPK